MTLTQGVIYFKKIERKGTKGTDVRCYSEECLAGFCVVTCALCGHKLWVQWKEVIGQTFTTSQACECIRDSLFKPEAHRAQGSK